MRTRARRRARTRPEGSSGGVSLELVDEPRNGGLDPERTDSFAAGLPSSGPAWILGRMAVINPQSERPRSPPTWPPAVGHALRTIDAGLLVAGAGGGIAVGLGAESGLLAAAAGAGWLAIELSPAGRWLRAVRRLEWARAPALVQTGLACAADRRGVPGALTRAGDAYERDGRARMALRALGAEPSRGVSALRRIAEQVGRLR